MIAPTNPSLDQNELLHLALDASRNGDSGAALAYLKQAVSRTDATATAHFLLGSEYAQIRMYEQAVVEMEAAVAIDPSLHIARFQLGLLLLSSGDAARAQETLQPLEALGMHHALANFAKGLGHLMRDEFVEAIQFLTQGIGLNNENPALNGDMQKIIDRVNQLPPEVLEKAKNGDSGSDDSQHIFLSAYTGKTNH